MDRKEFKIKMTPSDLSAEEKRRLLWEVFDLLITNGNKISKKFT